MARLGRHKDKMREGKVRRSVTDVGAVVVGGEWRRGKVGSLDSLSFNLERSNRTQSHNSMPSSSHFSPNLFKSQSGKMAVLSR